MRLFHQILLACLLLGIAISSSTTAAPGTHSWQAIATASPSFMQPSGPGFLPITHAGGPQQLSLPSSVMNHVDPVCSVEAATPSASCSVFPGPDQRCSAHCDANQHCSAFFNASGLQAMCSTFGKKKSLCSTLQPGANPQIGTSQCSAFGGSPNIQVMCSVMRPGKKQFCSSENPSINNMQVCSAQGASFLNQCSVLNGGTAAKNFCSTAFFGGTTTKRCSTFTGNAACSIGLSQSGICSNFVGAAAGTCSAHAAGSTCSVIGGSSGTFCMN